MSFIPAQFVLGQISNAGFEVWNASAYPDPADWDNLNQKTYTTGVNTCLQGSPGSPGSFYLLLMTQNVPGKGIVPGKAVSGKIDTTTYLPVSGFAFTSRPAQLNYNMQYMPYSSTDPSSVGVWLTKWDTLTGTRDTIASGYTKYAAMAHSWFASYTMLNYYSGNNPDTACIVISSSDSIPMAGSYIYIDNLQFSGSVIGVIETSKTNAHFEIYPNPSTENIILTGDVADGEYLVYDALGHLVLSGSIPAEQKINTSILENGCYYIHVKKDSFTQTKKFIKQ